MAAVSCAVSEEQLLCSICLEVFSAPVTTPCGHSFCRACINQHWDSSNDINCPVCKQDFSSRPQLKTNIILAEMVLELKNRSQDDDVVVEKAILEPQSAPEDVVCGDSAASGDVLCDVCPEPRHRALKSCLVCLASYCQEHLQPHLNNPRLKKHQLLEALPNLEERICPDHDRPLELFCRDHSHFICLECTSAGHKDHKAVPLKEEGEVQQATLKEQIKKRFIKIEDIRHSVELSQKNADLEIQEGIKLFNTLMECVQQGLDSFKKSIEEKHRKSEEEAAQLIKQIQTEISVLEQRAAEMEQLWSSGDHLQFVQTFTSAKPAPQIEDWKNTKICATYGVMLADAVTEWQQSQLEQRIRECFRANLKRLQQYKVNVTLDKDTAHENIRLEYHSTKAQYVSETQSYPENSKRFSSKYFVLGQQGFSSGQFYFEITVKGSRQWSVGVALESVRRKGYIHTTPSNGFWLIQWDEKDKECKISSLSVNRIGNMPRTIGVFVDYEQGQVSFFDVPNAILIGSFKNCSFTGKLLPVVSPGESGAMQIT